VQLENCLRSLAEQSALPDEVVVVWQDDDARTRDRVEALRSTLPFRLLLLHSQERGVVPAENLALLRSNGDIVLMIDDDAVAPAGWIQRHLSFYNDPRIGVVGGSADQYHPDGSRFQLRDREPIGRITRCGRMLGNMFDQIPGWRRRAPMEVDHTVGYNMSLRRSAFECFDERLLPYWQMFEADACLQAKARGFGVIFDFDNPVKHYPTNTAYVGGRNGDLRVKVFHSAFNKAFVLSKHTSNASLRALRIMYIVAVGSSSEPGLLSFLVLVRRHGNIRREVSILLQSISYSWRGWKAGKKAAG
jgi:glycosyltransferase involved in cell wall biosynthesis